MLYMFQAVSPPIIRSSKAVHNIGYMPSFLADTASVGGFQPASKLGIYPMLCKVFELLMMGGGTAWNMYSIDKNKEYYNVASCWLYLKE